MITNRLILPLLRQDLSFQTDGHSDHDAYQKIVEVVTAALMEPRNVSYQEFYRALRSFYGSAFASMRGNLTYFAAVCLGNLEDGEYIAAKALKDKYDTTLVQLGLMDFDDAFDFALKRLFVEIENMEVEERVKLLQCCSEDWKTKLELDTSKNLEKYISSKGE